MFAIKKLFYLIPMGLGIGFSVAVIVFSEPNLTLASPSTQIHRQNLNFVRISIPELNFVSLIRQSQTQLTFKTFDKQTTNSFFAPPQTHFLTLPHQATQNLILGDKVILTGQNNGTYIYRVLEIKEIPFSKLNQVKGDGEFKIMLISSLNLLGTKIRVITLK